MVNDTDPYEPSEAITSHPFWLKSYYWRISAPKGRRQISHLRRYLKEQSPVVKSYERHGKHDKFDYISFWYSMKWELDRIEGRRPRRRSTRHAR